MRILGLVVLFIGILVLQGLMLTEAFGTSPGTNIQLNANRPVGWIAAAPNYS
jgi:hypothetical protein